MIDLHSHILPGIDDGARSLEVSLEMARIAVADGTRVMACTPHIYPGLYMNDAAGIQAERDKLQQALDTFGIPLHLVIGADFRFGRGRLGDFALLQASGERHGFTVEAMGSVVVDGERVSSSGVRRALADGDMAHALAGLKKARERVANDASLSGEIRSEVLKQLDAEIARLGAEG